MRSKAFGLIRLDFATVRPYLGLRQGLLYLAALLFVTLSTAEVGGAGAAGLLAVLAAINAGLPFSLAERNKLDALYASLSISRKEVVLGRYGFSLIALLAALLAGAAWSLLVWALAGLAGPAGEAFLPRQGALGWAAGYFGAALTLFALVGLVQFLQLPLYFKLGYTRARFLSYLPFLMLGLLAAGLGRFAGDGAFAPWLAGILAWAEGSAGLLGAALAALWLLLGAFSLRLSLRFYERRDL
ncbi:MAG: ABC-2 transporter permease [Christensenellaceae bacterium]|jgi:hypothetical protein|nr:ABC-2 transporter permease [Christensenellaceae bacterium]